MTAFSMADISAAQLLKSFGVELAIFAGTLVIALVFKWTGVMNTDGGKGKQPPLKEKRFETTEAKLHSAKDDFVSELRSPGMNLASGPRQGQSWSGAKQKAMPVSRELSRLVETMVECGNRRQATEALSMYEELRSIGQLRAIRDHNSRNKQSPADIYGVLVQCAGRVNRPDLIDILISDMRRVGIERPMSFYESTMKLLASKKSYHEALAVHKQLEVDGLETSPVTLSCLINFAAEVGELERALAFYDRLSTVGSPSIRACMTVLRVHAKRQDWPKSLEVIRDMQGRGAVIDSLVLNVALATGVAAGELTGTRTLLDEGCRSNPPISDVVSYNTVLKGYAQHREVDKALGLLKQMLAQGVRANAITFNTVMDAAVRSSRPTDAWHVLAQMQQAGIAADKFTCTTLMKGLQDGATSEQLSIILDFLKRISTNCDPALSSSLFRSVIEAAARLNNADLTARAVAQMREQQVVLSPAEYQRLVQMVTSTGESSRCADICSGVPIEGNTRALGAC